MKLLFTEGVGAVQTTTNAQDEKIKIFASEEDMLDNIATLQENEIVATNDATEADLIGNMLTEINVLKEQLALSNVPDWENAITYSTLLGTPQTFTVPKKGFITWDLTGFDNRFAYVKVNDIMICKKTSNAASWMLGCTGTCPVGAGDVVEYQEGYSANESFAGTSKVIFVPYKGE